MATKKDTNPDESAESPLVASINPTQREILGDQIPTGTTDEEDVRAVASGNDPKDDPTRPDDVSAIADPEDPTQIMDAGEDPDFA